MDKPTYEELLTALTDVVGDHCMIEGKLNSCAMSGDADAIRLLSRAGIVELEVDRGSMVVGRFGKATPDE